MNQLTFLHLSPIVPATRALAGPSSRSVSRSDGLGGFAYQPVSASQSPPDHLTAASHPMAHPDSVPANWPVRTIAREDDVEMPMTRRGTSRLLDTIDDHGAAVTRTSLTLRSALMDGVIDPLEMVAIDQCLGEMAVTYAVVTSNGETIDQTMTIIRGLAHSGDIMAPQVQRSFREFTQDRQRLDAARPSLTYGEVVDTYTRLDGKHPMERPGVTSAAAD